MLIALMFGLMFAEGMETLFGVLCFGFLGLGLASSLAGLILLLLSDKIKKPDTTAVKDESGNLD